MSGTYIMRYTSADPFMYGCFQFITVHDFERCVLRQGTKNNMGDDAGEMGDDLMAVPLGTATASVVTAGCDHTCAITDDGAVMCW